MYIEIEQNKRNDLFSFQVKVNGELKYMSAKTDERAKSVQYINIFSKIKVTDIYGQVPFRAGWKYMDELVNYMIPYKQFLPGGRDMGIFEVTDGYGNPVGAFSTNSNGVFDTHKTIMYYNHIIHGYDVSHGRERSVSFYINNDTEQIAELIKPLVVKDNMDYYYLYLKDEYAAFMPILMYFTIYFDLLYYPHIGQFQKNFVQVDKYYTYTDANKYYNPNWVTDNFGPYAKNAMYAKIDALVVEAKSNAAMVGKLALISISILLPIIAILFIVQVLL